MVRQTEGGDIIELEESDHFGKMNDLMDKVAVAMGVAPEGEDRMFDLPEYTEHAEATMDILFNKIAELEKKLSQAQEANELSSSVAQNKRDKLNEIRHGLTELTERMMRPYIILPELRAVIDVLDILSETGTCNSVIIEGEPGTGKTALAYAEVGQELQDSKNSALIHIRVKETMNAQDLLYTIDDVRRLNDSQAKAEIPQALRNEAVIWKDKIMGGEIDPTEDLEYKKFSAKLQAVSELSEHTKDLDYINYVELGPLGEAIKQSSEGKNVWLVIDEIEKGREELMTGMLDEIENLEFTIGETGTQIKGDKTNLRIIITTNTEDSDKIPQSFRRRSLYHFMNYPTPKEMAEIVDLYFEDLDRDLLDYALNIFYRYHDSKEVQKKPSTPELLAWLQVLVREYKGEIPGGVPHKEILLKFKEDQELEIAENQVEAKETIESSRGKLPNHIQRAMQGEPVYQLTENLDDYHMQEGLSSFFAKLRNAQVSFVTPQFSERSGWEYNEQVTLYDLAQKFRLIMPGVESLGNGYYVIPQESIDLLKDVIYKEIKVNHGGVEFTSVDEQTPDYTRGSFRVSDETKEGYVVDGLIITEENYVS